MRNLFIVCIIMFFCLSLVAQNLWNEPVMIQQNQPLSMASQSSAPCGNGFVDVWSDFRDGHDKVYAQFITFNGVKQWGEEGIAIDPSLNVQKNAVIYPAEDGGVIVLWHSAPNLNQNDGYNGYKAQKLNFQGQKLWGTNGIAINNSIFLKSDGLGGFYYFEKNNNGSSYFCHITSNGIIQKNTFVLNNFDQTIQYIQIFMLNNKNLILKLDHNLFPNDLVCADTTGNILWSKNLDAGQDISFVNHRDHSFSIFSPYKNKIIRYNPNGSTKFSHTFDSYINLVTLVSDKDDHLYLLGKSSNTKIWKIDNQGQLDWVTEVLGNELVISPGNDVGCYFSRMALTSLNQLFVMTFITDNGLKSPLLYSQLINSDGTLVWGKEGRKIADVSDHLSNFSFSVKDEYTHVLWHDLKSGQIAYSNQNKWSDQSQNGTLITGFNKEVKLLNTISNGQVIYSLWQETSNNYDSNLYYQVTTNSGDDLVPRILQKLSSRDFYFYDENLKAELDDEGNLIVVFNCNGRVFLQKINSSGEKLLSESGLRLFDESQRLSLLDSRQIVFVDQQTIYYFCNYREYSACNQSIIGQKINGNQLMWGNNGKIIVNTQSFSGNDLTPKLFNEDHVLIWKQYQSDTVVNKWTKLTDQGTIEPGLNPQGNLINTLQDFYIIRYLTSQAYPDKIFAVAQDQNNTMAITAYSCQMDSLWTQTTTLDLFTFNTIWFKDIFLEDDKLVLILRDYNSNTNDYHIFGTLLIINENGLSLQFVNKELYQYRLNHSAQYRVINDKLIILAGNGSELLLRAYDMNLDLINQPHRVSVSDFNMIQNCFMDLGMNNELFVGWKETYNGETYPELEHQMLYIQKVSLNQWLDNLDEPELQNNSFNMKNYPNPFNPTTTISFNLPQKSEIELNIFNIKGQKVKTLNQGVLDKGEHKIVWNGNNEQGNQVASGVYYYKLKAKNSEKIRKMLIIK